MFEIKSVKNHKEQSAFCIEKLKEICLNQYGYSFENEDILRGENGKPYFANNDKLHFNISHSKEMAAIVVDDKECGVDIELLRDIRYGVADRFFTTREKEWINEADGDEKIKRFFTVWTGKEAYTKMLGCGLTKPMDSFCILDEEIWKSLEYKEYDGYLVCVSKSRA